MGESAEERGIVLNEWMRVRDGLTFELTHQQIGLSDTLS